MGRTTTGARPLAGLRGLSIGVKIGLVVVALGGLGVGCWAFVRHRLRVVPGVPIAELFVPGAPCATLVLVEDVAIGGGKSGRPTAAGRRLTAIDACTGARLAVEVTDHQACWLRGDALWCRDEHGRDVRHDPRTLAVRETAPGSGARATWHRGVAQAGACDLSVGVPHGGGHLVLREDGLLTTDPPPPAESAVPLAPALRLPGAGFLGFATAGEGAAAAPAVLLHDEGRAVTRVEDPRTRRWSASLPGTCRRAERAGDVLVVVLAERDTRAVGIDLATGARRWTFAW